jgi:predicted ATPase/DNA-binding CsgD family transcriptional regulator
MSNLPSLQPLVGREQTLYHAARLLQQSRLLTLTGPAGVGKTSLALHLAHSEKDAYENGAWFVDCSTASTPREALETLALTLGLKYDPADPLPTLLTDLPLGATLLVLDNLEQILAVGRDLTRLLDQYSKLKILATSRESLNVPAETTLVLGPLTSPNTQETLSSETMLATTAVQLFLARARQVNPGFELTSENIVAVAWLCVRLDGLPLALELAAAQAALLSPHAMLRRLESYAPLPLDRSPGRTERQRSLNAVLRSSYDLLQPAEQQALCAFSILNGAFSLELAAALLQKDSDDMLEVLARLASLHLIKPLAAEEEPHFVLLETVRHFARKKLSPKIEETLMRTFVQHMVESTEHSTSYGAEIEAWYQRFDSNQTHLTTALTYAHTHALREASLRLFSHLWLYWFQRGQLAVGRTWTQRSVEPWLKGIEDIHLGRALTGAATLATEHLDVARAEKYFQRAITLWEALGTVRDQAIVTYNYGRLLAQTHRSFEAAKQFEEVVIITREGFPELLSYALMSLAEALIQQERYESAPSLLEESLGLCREAKDRAGECCALLIYAWLAFKQLDFAAALARAELAESVAEASEHRIYLSEALLTQGIVLEALQQTTACSQALSQGLELSDGAGTVAGETLRMGILTTARLARHRGQNEVAMRLIGAFGSLDKKARADTSSTHHSVLHHPFVSPLIEELRAALPSHSFAQQLEQGRLLPLSEAIALAKNVCEQLGEEHSQETLLELPLTPRELEVLGLVAKGLTNEQIGVELNISRYTARAHVNSSLFKLEVTNRAQAVALATERGWLKG